MILNKILFFLFKVFVNYLVKNVHLDDENDIFRLCFRNININGLGYVPNIYLFEEGVEIERRI